MDLEDERFSSDLYNSEDLLRLKRDWFFLETPLPTLSTNTEGETPALGPSSRPGLGAELGPEALDGGLFSPERALHRHKLSWHPGENRRRKLAKVQARPLPPRSSELRAGPGGAGCEWGRASRLRPVRQPHRAGPSGRSGKPGCAQTTLNAGSGNTVPPRGPDDHMSVTLEMQATLEDRTKWRRWHWRTPEPEPPVLLPRPCASRPAPHSRYTLLQTVLGLWGPGMVGKHCACSPSPLYGLC